jgi:hypothetical protein
VCRCYGFFYSVVQSVQVKAQIRISTKDKNTDVWQTDVSPTITAVCLPLLSSVISVALVKVDTGTISRIN